MNNMNNISNQIKKYILKIESAKYVINNYDYFTSQYKLPSNTEINIPDEYRILLNFAKKVSKDKSIIDVGGNCGLFCIPIEKEGYKVFTFEPINMNVELLKLNKVENNCDNLTIVQKALSNNNSKKKIFIPYCSDNTSFNLSVAISNMTIKDYVEEVVSCQTFDSWINKNKDVNVGFIKIDVQGYEKEVLEGMQKFLKECNDVYIFVEWDEKHTTQAGSSLGELETLITSNGFTALEQIYGDKLFYKN
jgi:FkbM family methyltransferase